MTGNLVVGGWWLVVGKNLHLQCPAHVCLFRRKLFGSLLNSFLLNKQNLPVYRHLTTGNHTYLLSFLLHLAFLGLVFLGRGSRGVWVYRVVNGDNGMLEGTDQEIQTG
jgi:hypothetical protein